MGMSDHVKDDVTDGRIVTPMDGLLQIGVGQAVDAILRVRERLIQLRDDLGFVCGRFFVALKLEPRFSGNTCESPQSKISRSFAFPG